MKRVGDAILNLLSVWFDRHLTADEIKDILLSGYASLDPDSTWKEADHQRVVLLTKLLVDLGWIQSEVVDRKPGNYPETMIEEAKTWLRQLYGEPVIRKGVLSVHTGLFLDVLDAEGDYHGFVHEQSERLLSHVEYRRQRGLSEFNETLNKSEVFREKVNVSIFFSRYARRHGDLRFLNAVFKLNEWLLRAFKGMNDVHMRLFFLLALAEQETAARELMS